MTNTDDCARSALSAGLGATHWIDDRKLVLTNNQREELGSAYKHAYNVPCRMVRGKAKPLFQCPDCKGTGVLDYDHCDKCHGAGGLPKDPNA